MSDQEKTEMNQPDDAAVEAEAVAPTPAAEAPPAAPARKGSSGVAWLAILLVLGVAGATGWVVMEAQKREATVTSRLTALESTVESSTRNKDTRLEDLSEQLTSEFKQGLSGVESAASSEAFRLSKSIETLESQLTAAREELSRFSSADRDSWLLAEAEYLLRLANQRLIMASDAEAAKALLTSADKVLRQLDNTALHDVRRAVAADLAAVRAVPKIDVEGIYLRLSALVEQAGSLRIFQLPEREEAPLRDQAQSWKDTLREGYEAALEKLSDYIIIRRRDVPMQTLMDPQWEGLVRQNLRMLLEQAQVALLSGNQVLYTESLARARHWVGEFAESDTAAAQALSRELTQLGDEQVSVEMPDLSRSLQALDDAMERRLEQGGGE